MGHNLFILSPFLQPSDIIMANNLPNQQQQNLPQPDFVVVRSHLDGLATQLPLFANIPAAQQDGTQQILAQLGIINGRLDTIHGRLDTIDGRLDTVDGRLDTIHGRLDTIDGRLDTIDGRLDTVDGRLDTIHGRLDTIDGRLDAVEIRLTAIEIRAENERYRKQNAHLLASDRQSILHPLLDIRTGAPIENCPRTTDEISSLSGPDASAILNAFNIIPPPRVRDRRERVREELSGF
ncbi:uncharacterized protein E0L32_001197 [Thyridium curvatum]|uniref:t-SNARE coiled-coil homology domain-containing protein n=1 Tax=Thyridium curvatum TaxID=1093900 RepID=A0A507B263_9PEZI|nr:uncharacterized protein E0L32_001197 [Thyridium curvatum]TPX11379.1 hypothetical protein E0L32_001197 [Thyridium curvatum]